MATAAQPAASLELPSPKLRAWGFHGQRGITAAFAPADPGLYRSLLPLAFDMPESPLVVVSVIDYHVVDAPLVRYREGYVLLASRYKRQPAWWVVTMPVDDRTACDSGRSIGFPKYVADRIDLVETDRTWLGTVEHAGRDVMRVTFVPNTGAGPATRMETDPGWPCVLHRPPLEGPLISQVDMRLFGPRRTVSIAGVADVHADPGEAWAGLLPAGGASLPATLDELTGDWILRQSKLISPSVFKSLASRVRSRRQ